jgi:hypothetical protein
MKSFDYYVHKSWRWKSIIVSFGVAHLGTKSRKLLQVKKALSEKNGCINVKTIFYVGGP